MKLATYKNRIALSLAALTLSIAALPAMAGRIPGPARIIENVLKGTTDRYVMTFRAGEVARIAARGDGDIDIKVYDENDRLIASDTDDDNVPVVSWTPRWTGQFTVRVINAENYDIDYALVTN